MRGAGEELKGKEGCYKKTVEAEHGGVATREYYITEDTGWYSEKKKWKGLKSFGMVHKRLKKPDGSQEEEYRCYICSIGEDADEFERASRRHWGVENKLHWQMDFTFRDDKNTSMAKTGAKNLQTMKKIALSILALVKNSCKLSMKRLRTVTGLREWGRKNAVHAGCGRHKESIRVKREISREIEHVFIFFDCTRDGVAVYNNL